jgi:hypothetical protein
MSLSVGGVVINDGDYMEFPDGWKRLNEQASGGWSFEPVTVEEVRAAAQAARGQSKPNFFSATPKAE